MAEILAKLRFLWIEHGDKAAVVLAVVVVLLLLAIQATTKTDGGEKDGTE